MTQEYTPVEWVDETENQVGTVINKARLDQMQTAHHYADGFREVDTVPTADPGVNYHMVVFCTADTTFYRWNGTQWVKDVDDSTLALLEAHEADHDNPHAVTKAQVGLGNVDNTSDMNKPVSSAMQTALDGKVDKLVTKPTAGTYTQITINSEGQVIGGANPTTLAGYGITDAVTLNTVQTITGIKTFNNEVKLENPNPYTSGDQYTPALKFNAGNNKITGQIAGISGNNINGISLQIADPVTNTYTGNLTLYADGSHTWAQAPNRPYSSANVNDVVTIGSLASNPNVVHTIGDETLNGTKTFNGQIRMINPTPYTSGDQYSRVIEFWPTPDRSAGHISASRDGNSGSIFFQLNNPTTGAYQSALMLNTDGTNSWATAPSRAYNPFNAGDVLTIGNVPSMFASSVYSVRFWNSDHTQGVNDWTGFGFVYNSNNAPSNVLTLNDSTEGKASFTVKKKCMIISTCQMVNAGGENFGVALVMNGTRTQSPIVSSGSAQVTKIDIANANTDVYWQMYGTFTTPQNYNEICSAQFTVIPLE